MAQSFLRRGRADEVQDRYPLVVDAEGDPVPGGWRPGLWVARQPPAALPVVVGQRFVGGPRSEMTIASRFDFERRSEILERKLDKAILFAAQSDEGTRLLDLTHAQGYSLAFDDSFTRSRSADALCDHANTTLWLSSRLDAGALGLALIHEMQHVESHANGLVRDQTDTLGSATRKDRALEACARVSEARHVAEIELGRPGDPPHRFKPPAKGIFAARYPVMAKALDAALPYARQEKWPKFAANVFKSYYRETAIVANYDEALIREVFVANLPERPPKVQPGGRQTDAHRQFHAAMPRYMTRNDAGHAAIADKIMVDGRKYLRGAGFDLDSPAMADLTPVPAVAAAYLELATKVVSLFEGRPEKPDFHARLYDGAAVEAPRGLHDYLRPLGRLFRRVAADVVDHVQTIGGIPKLKPEPPIVVFAMPGQAVAAPPTVLAGFASAQHEAAGIEGHAGRSANDHLRLSIEALSHGASYARFGKAAPIQASRTCWIAACWPRRRRSPRPTWNTSWNGWKPVQAGTCRRETLISRVASAACSCTGRPSPIAASIPATASGRAGRRNPGGFRATAFAMPGAWPGSWVWCATSRRGKACA